MFGKIRIAELVISIPTDPISFTDFRDFDPSLPELHYLTFLIDKKTHFWSISLLPSKYFSLRFSQCQSLFRAKRNKVPFDLGNETESKA